MLRNAESGEAMEQGAPGHCSGADIPRLSQKVFIDA